MVPALLHLAHTEGTGALYAGLGTAAVSLSVSNLLYYAMYALLRDAVLRTTQRRSLGGAAALPVAAAAGALNVLATTPLWVLVTRLQARERAHTHLQRPHKASSGGDGGNTEQQPSGAQAEQPSVGASRVLEVARGVYAEAGLAGFWRGTSASLVMVANPVVQFAVYEWLMARALAAAAAANSSSRGKSSGPSSWAVFSAGALSKLAATLVTYPFLVLKSRQQAARQQVPAPAPGAGGHAAVPPSARLVAQLLRVAREEGIQGMRTRARARTHAHVCVAPP